MAETNNKQSIGKSILAWTWCIIANIIFIGALICVIINFTSNSNSKTDDLASTKNLSAKTIKATSVGKSAEFNDEYAVIAKSKDSINTTYVIGKPTIKDGKVTYYSSKNNTLSDNFASREIAQARAKSIEAEIKDSHKIYWASLAVIVGLILLSLLLDWVTKCSLQPTPLIFLITPFYAIFEGGAYFFI